MKMMKFRVLGIASSLREDASSTNALAFALNLIKKHDGETKMFDLRQTPLPLFNPSESSSITEIKKAKEYVKWADGYILATPDYHGSMSGAMKNFLDYFWAEFAGKIFGYICASNEKGLTAMDQMRTAVRQCYGWSLPYGVSINESEDYVNHKISEKLESRLSIMSRDLVTYGIPIRKQFIMDLESNVSDTFAFRYR